jgi:uncharacterized protein (TIGR03435 family)
MLTRMSKLQLRIALALVMSTPILSQTDNLPRFEVASIKPSPPPLDPRNFSGGQDALPGGGLRVRSLTLRQMIACFYRIECQDNCHDFISGGPDWMDSARYDIEARPPKSTESLDHLTAGQRGKQFYELLRQRGQALLADRFQLVLRRESKKGQTYAIRLAKNGHKLQPGDGPGLVTGSNHRLTGKNASMENLAGDLTRILGRPVVDETGLTGGFNVTLNWSPLRDESAAKANVAPDVSGQSIFGALQSQLGLRLETVRGPVEKLIVVRAERPSEN